MQRGIVAESNIAVQEFLAQGPLKLLIGGQWVAARSSVVIVIPGD